MEYSLKHSVELKEEKRDNNLFCIYLQTIQQAVTGLSASVINFLSSRIPNPANNPCIIQLPNIA
jgi:hypothetical protein